MATLLLRLAAPLQAWGSDSKFETRRTGREPSKSGIVGLLAAALGYRRYEFEVLVALNKLRFGVRTDKEGKLLRDFHTAHKDPTKPPYVTKRYYLSDAVFLVGLEGDKELLERLEYALSHPVFPLFLGRRSCPPTLPLCIGIRDATLIDALRGEPALVENPRRAMRITADAMENDKRTSVQRDIAVSFDPRCRRHNFRTVAEYEPINYSEAEHDPFGELGDANVSVENQT